MRFNRGDLNIASDLGVASNQDRTLFLVMDYSVQTTNNEIFGTSTGAAVDVGTWPTRDWSLRLRQGDNLFSENNTVPSGSNLLLVEGDAGGTEAWRNGTLILSSTEKRFHWAIAGNLAIGGANFSSRDYIGDLAEVILYDRALTPWEINQVGYYLADKYSLDSTYVIPEPATLLVWSLLTGLGVALGWRRKR